MEIGILKQALIVSCSLSLAASAANAASPEKAKQPFADADHVVYTPVKGAQPPNMNKANLTNHGGGVIASPHLVYLFWGPQFCGGGSQVAYASTLQAFRNLFGSTPEWKTINQYGVNSPVNLAAGSADGFDCSTPPINVTDAIVQSHVNAYLSTHAFDNSAIYEVVIPSTSYSSSGGSTSCGGPSLAYCAYHGSYSTGGHTAKYSIQPWPSCSGCAIAATAVQDQEVFVCHETREAATDPVNGWWDGTTGQEADDKCASLIFVGTGGYTYQEEWSNADRMCVKTK
jgi:hypothetical protein